MSECLICGAAHSACRGSAPDSDQMARLARSVSVSFKQRRGLTMTQDKGATTYTEGQPPTTELPRQPMIPPQNPDGTQKVADAPVEPEGTVDAAQPAKPARTRATKPAAAKPAARSRKGK